MALPVRLTVLLLTLFAQKVCLVFGDIGTAIAYNPPYLPTECFGSRQDQFPSGNFFVAVSEGLWDNGAACGRSYRLRCLSGKSKPCKDGYIEVVVVNLCPKSPCPSTLLMSNDAFAAISRIQNTRVNVEFTPI